MRRQQRTEIGDSPDKGVDLDSLNVVEGLDRLPDLPLVALDVNNEDEGVVLLNLLHRSLGVQGVGDDPVGIHAGSMGNRLSRVAGVARELQGLGKVEGG